MFEILIERSEEFGDGRAYGMGLGGVMFEKDRAALISYTGIRVSFSNVCFWVF
jgi:hypothetical protein